MVLPLSLYKIAINLQSAKDGDWEGNFYMTPDFTGVLQPELKTSVLEQLKDLCYQKLDKYYPNPETSLLNIQVVAQVIKELQDRPTIRHHLNWDKEMRHSMKTALYDCNYGNNGNNVEEQRNLSLLEKSVLLRWDKDLYAVNSETDLPRAITYAGMVVLATSALCTLFGTNSLTAGICSASGALIGSRYRSAKQKPSTIKNPFLKIASEMEKRSAYIANVLNITSVPLSSPAQNPQGP